MLPTLSYIDPLSDQVGRRGPPTPDVPPELLSPMPRNVRLRIKWRHRWPRARAILRSVGRRLAIFAALATMFCILGEFAVDAFGPDSVGSVSSLYTRNGAKNGVTYHVDYSFSFDGRTLSDTETVGEGYFKSLT